MFQSPRQRRLISHADLEVSAATGGYARAPTFSISDRATSSSYSEQPLPALCWCWVMYGVMVDQRSIDPQSATISTSNPAYGLVERRVAAPLVAVLDVHPLVVHDADHQRARGVR